MGSVEDVLAESRTWPEANPGPRPATSLTTEELTRRALDAVRASNVLGRLWARPITRRHLGAELDRIMSRTKDPATLNRIVERLGGDRTLLAECLARPLLAQRLLLSAFTHDMRIHGSVAASARAAVERATDLDALREAAPRSAVMTFRRGSPAGPAEDEPGVWLLEEEEWRVLKRQLVDVPQASAINDEGTDYVLQVRLPGDEGSVTVLRMWWPKLTLESWWGSVSKDYGEELDPTPAGEEEAGGPEVMGADECTVEQWSPIAGGPPEPRKWHTMVWTGREAIVWGGCSPAAGCGTDTGARYDTLTDTWTPISTDGAPDRRFHGVAVWTGSEMFVWGGQKSIPAQTMEARGGLYDPATDTWRPIATFNQPSAVVGQTALWTGTEVIVFGNAGTASSAFMYNPETDTWRRVLAPHHMIRQAAVWTGNHMIAWGGRSGAVDTPGPLGLLFDPATDEWVTLPPAPITSRIQHTAVWTGTEMIVWGGGGFDAPSAHLPGTGAAYDPATSSWRELSVVAAPPARGMHVAVWTGVEMIVWGGRSALGTGEWYSWNEGGRYDPATDTWSELEPYSFASGGGTENAAAVWTGEEMIVWGGDGRHASETAIGGRYHPESRTWLAMAAHSAPSGRPIHRPVWTGAEMVVWGEGAGFPMRDGRRYRPAFDAWLPMTIEAAPQARHGHEAVWTGREVIVWGGFTTEWEDGGEATRSGGRYDPASDTWRPTTEDGAPIGRVRSASAWTGTEMIVWGGFNSGRLTHGGRYDPVADRWRTMSTSGAPAARADHEVLWGASRAIVWGGNLPALTNTGARYDPATDTWAPTTTTDAPGARYLFSAVWLADRMMVWGGGGDFSRFGGAYDPTTDAWEALDPDDAPLPRYMHRAVRAGERMIVWGGCNIHVGCQLDTGGIYDLGTDTWRPTPMVGAPPPRYRHALVWTGQGLVVWGGFPQQGNGAFLCVLDTGAPEIPAITSPVEGTLLGGDAVTVAGAGEMGTHVTVRLGSEEVGSTTVSGVGEWSVDIVFTDGTHSVTASASRLGVESAPSAPRSFTVDSTLPTVTITGGPDGTVTSRQATFHFVSSDAVSFTCRLDSGTPTPCSSPHTITGLSAGPHSFEVWGTNALGTVGPPATRSWLIESVPGVLITDVPDPIRDGQAVSLSVSGTADPGSVVEVTVSDGVRATPPEATTADASGIWNVTGMNVRAVANGPVVVTAVSTNPDGVESTDDRTVIKRESLRPPTVSIANNGFGYIGPDDSPEAVPVEVTYGGPEASMPVELRLIDPEGTVWEVGSDTFSLGETRIFTVDLSDLSDGQLSVVADAEGLTATASVTLDRGAPVVSIDPHQPVMVHASPLFSNVVFRGEATDEISPIWTVRVTVARDGGPVFSMAASRSAYDRELRWTADLRGFGLVRGSYTITVVATDEAGNTSEPVSTRVEIV